MRLAFAALLAAAASVTAARATPSFTTANLPLVSLGTSANPGFVASVASWATPGGETVTLTPGTGSPQTGLYSGNTPNIALSPFGGGTQNYLAAEPGGSITIGFATPQTALGLLWGTPDSYNLISFGTGQTLTGNDLAQALGTSLLTTEEVLISGLAPFTTATFTSSQAAFEFVPTGPVAVSEPRAVYLYIAGLGALLIAAVGARLTPRRLIV